MGIIKNIITGWITTLLGLALIAITVADFYGWVTLPDPGFITKATQLKVAFIVGLYLFIVAPGTIEKTLTGFINNWKNGKAETPGKKSTRKKRRA